MIKDTLQFLKEELNNHFDKKTDGLVNEVVSFMSFADDQAVSFKTGTITPVIVNLEEEKILRSQQTVVYNDGGSLSRVNPEIRILLKVLFVSKFGNYLNSMEYLSEIISYFQSNKVFQREYLNKSGYQNLNKLIIELINLPFSEQNEVWNAMRTHYLPSALYKISLLAFKDMSPKPLLGLSSPPQRKVEKADNMIMNEDKTSPDVSKLISFVFEIIEPFHLKQQKLCGLLKEFMSGVSKKKDIDNLITNFHKNIKPSIDNLNKLKNKNRFFLENNEVFESIQNKLFKIGNDLKNEFDKKSGKDFLEKCQISLYDEKMLQAILTLRHPIWELLNSLKKLKSIIKNLTTNVANFKEFKSSHSLMENINDLNNENWSSNYLDLLENLLEFSKELGEDLKRISFLCTQTVKLITKGGGSKNKDVTIKGVVCEYPRFFLFNLQIILYYRGKRIEYYRNQHGRMRIVDMEEKMPDKKKEKL